MSDPNTSGTPDQAEDGAPTPDPVAVTSDEWSRETTLRDGTEVLLRQIRPSDRDRLAEGLARLSPSSRYLRFHSSVDHLSEKQLDELTQVDHHDHEAIVAIDLERLDRPGVGVARFIREPYEPEVAEAAITVADEYHGQGAGTMLLGALASRAREEGVEVFRSYVLDGNLGMLEVFDHLGAHRERETDGLWRVDLAVPEDDSDVPSSGAGRAFLELAREERRLVSILPPIWSRWRCGGPRRQKPSAEPDATSPEPDAAGAEPDAASPEADAAGADDLMAVELEELRGELDGWLQRRDER